MEVLSQLFEQYFHSPVERVQPLQGELGGSGRSIIRLSNRQQSAIGILYGVREENAAFLEFSRHFRQRGLPVPEIYAERLSEGAYLEQDLGDVTLFDFLSQNRDGDVVAPAVVETYGRVLEILPRFQVEAGRDLNYKFCYPRASFDRQSINWDLNYFKYYFLRLAGIPFNEQALEQDFTRLTKFLLSANHDYFLYRDFQSRNIMLHDGTPFFVDYQGGRRGALQYDVASLLYDAKADLPPALRQQLLDHYLESLRNYIPITREVFMQHYYAFVYVRLMQAFGAYGFRGFYERKAHFLQSVPYALKNLRWLLHNVTLPIELPTLIESFQRMLGSEKLLNLHFEAPRGPVSAPTSDTHLAVRIYSFSFHRGGAPKDDSGNGGGFVFDGRGIPNPGREERFKRLTGRDAPVIEYLDHQESAHEFLDHVRALVDASVSEYQRRGFKNLMVSFGCTGGQHRSVYLAEQLAKHLRIKSGVDVTVHHRELEKAAAEAQAVAAESDGLMKAMVLAAGLGRRLRPLTEDRPKALVEVAGRTLLEITLTRLRDFGVHEVIINVHHFGEMIEAYLKTSNNFGLQIEISRENDVLLDTGGGLKKAAHFFQQRAGSEQPFILHNVDVISNIDFAEMLKFHIDRKALATLAVQDRETSRYLLFDESLELCGRRSGREGKEELVRPSKKLLPLAFCGIHVISPRFLTTMPGDRVFSIIDSYLRVAEEREKILGFRADRFYWRDLGKPDNVTQAAADIESQRILLPN